MESKTEINFPQAKSINDAVIYRAVGWVAGTYQPSEDDVHQGIFSTEDGLSIPAQLTGQLRGRLRHRHPEYVTQPDFFSQTWRWMVYPKTEPLQFDLTAMKQLKTEPTNRLGLDQFCVVGLVKSIESGRVDVRIQRNQPPRQGGKKASFKLTLAGSLPEIALGQIWELKVRRDGENLTIVDGQLYQPSPADLVWLEQQQQAAIQSNLSAPIKQQHKSHHQEDIAIAAPKSPAVIPALESLDAPSGLPLASVSASAQTKAQQQQVLPKPAKTPAQQQQILPKPAKTPAQQQQVLSKPAKIPAQQQQILPKPAKMLAQQHDKLASGKKQLSPEITNSSAPQQQKPVFQVKVNDRVFNGYKSVTLNRRVVCVDGKPIAQTKMAIVVGQPKTMQADGGVTQGNNQAVLLSK